MGLPIRIEDLLNGEKVEWQRLEFKEGFNPIEVMHTLCAFANDFHNVDGGYLVLGVAENQGRPVLPPQGLNPDSLDSIQKKIREIGHRIVPEYHPVLEPCVFQGQHLLQIWAPGGQNRPYQAPKSLGEKGGEYGFSFAATLPRSRSNVTVRIGWS